MQTEVKENVPDNISKLLQLMKSVTKGIFWEGKKENPPFPFNLAYIGSTSKKPVSDQGGGSLGMGYFAGRILLLPLF